MLYYPTMDRKLFSFNVDTRENTEINIGMKVGTIASFTGIDCKVKAVFYYNKCTYTLNNDNSVTEVSEKQDNYLTTLFPSTSSPSNIKDAVLKYDSNLIKGGNKINTNDLIEFQDYYSVVRIYKDIFLTFDTKTNSWVLVRIVTP